MPDNYCAEVPALHDAGLFVGNYPYRALPLASPAEVTGWMKSQNISSAIATPFECIFYRDPVHALLPWLETAVPGLTYWLPVNPLHPAALSQVGLACADNSVAGIRLFPRYHGYGCDHPALDQVLKAAANFGLPVNLTARILDDRLHPYPFHADAPLLPQDVSNLINSHANLDLVLSFFTMHELAEMRTSINAAPQLTIDIGCAKPFEFWGDDLRALAPVQRFIYGSGAPLHYHLGNRISLHRAGFSPEEERAILVDNLRNLLRRKQEVNHT